MTRSGLPTPETDQAWMDLLDRMLKEVCAFRCLYRRLTHEDKRKMECFKL